VGGGDGGRARDGGDARDPDLSPACRHRSLDRGGSGMSWSFLLAPVGIGALALAAFAWLWHNLVRREAWPGRWW